jgi:uncharacterized protein (DUF4415 family)
MRKEYDFAKLKPAEPKYLRRAKAAVTMRVDPTVLAYFRALAGKSGLPYQSLINYVFRDDANRSLEPSANWGKASTRTKKAG